MPHLTCIAQTLLSPPILFKASIIARPVSQSAGRCFYVNDAVFCQPCVCTLGVLDDRSSFGGIHASCRNVVRIVGIKRDSWRPVLRIVW